MSETQGKTNDCSQCGKYLGEEMNRVESRIIELKNKISFLQMSLADYENHWIHLEEGFCDSHCHFIHDGGKVSFEKD